MGSIPESARSPGEGNGNPLQYSCLENSMDRGASWATDHRVVMSQIQLRDFHSLTHRLEMCSIGTCWENASKTKGQHYKISLIKSVVDKSALLTDRWLNFFWEDPKCKIFHNNFKAWVAFFHYANICSDGPKAMVGKVLTVATNYAHKIKMPFSLSWWNRNATNFIQLRHLFTHIF